MRSHGSGTSCLMPSEILGLSPSPVSMLSSTASTSSPFWNSSLGCLTRWVHDMSLMWTRPSIPSSISTKMPKSAMLRTLPRTTVPGGYLEVSASYGFGSSCFMPSEMRLFLTSMSSTTASTVSPTATILDGCLTRRVHDISEMWTRPCLLYTSDAADERSSVDLGGRRIIKKKKTEKKHVKKKKKKKNNKTSKLD